MGDRVKIEGQLPSVPSVEERLEFLEREASFWRAKFEELEKWRENLEEWVLSNFGFHIRTNTRTPGAAAKLNSFFSSLSNGWSPDSSDLSRGHLPDDAVPKRKRGRPKKNQAVSVITCAPGPNTTSVGSHSDSTPEMKSESNDNTQWDTEGENGSVALITVPIKRGRGRPRKIRAENGEIIDDDDKDRKKPGRKRREPGMPYTRTCDVCGLEFENNQDLLAHKRVVHPEKFHKCTICNDTYLHAGFLARHMETHTLDRNYKCHLCISSFNTYQLLKTHCFEKHGVDLGRQSDWKRDTELAYNLKQQYGQQPPPQPPQQQSNNEGYRLQPPPRSQSQQSMISSPASSCGNDNISGRNDLGNHSNLSPHPQQMHSIIQQQQQQQQQHGHHPQGPPPPPPIHHPHHMQQQSTPPPHSIHHSQALPLPPHHHGAPPPPPSHHHHQQQHHHHHQHRPQRVDHHHRLNDDDDDVDSMERNFPLDFGSNGPDTLPPLFDPTANEEAMNNYLNNMEPNAMQLY